MALIATKDKRRSEAEKTKQKKTKKQKTKKQKTKKQKKLGGKNYLVIQTNIFENYSHSCDLCSPNKFV